MAARRPALAGGFYWVGFLFVVVCLNGCSGGSDVDTQQVSGTVTYKGQPVADVNVTFNPDGDGWPATGTTDAEGQFESLTTREGGDGIAEGQYTVTLSQVTGASTDVVDDVNAYSPTAASDLPFPTKYLNTAESDLKITISADGEKTLTLELKD